MNPKPDLFRGYNVCFVGYSINDPVLRYMMDALAADRLLGESPPEMFAFGSYPKGKEAACSDEWRAKNVTPILYRQTRNHSFLHKTLHAWASTYRDGVRGKEMIISQHATTPPLAPSCSDFAVGRVLWALTDEPAAKRFADLDPVPPLEWLEPLSKAQFRHEDLPRFGVTPNPRRDDKLSFSAIFRPTPYTHAPRMSVAHIGGHIGNWDGVMLHLARWLIRHLGDPKLLLWLAKHGGQLHERFADLVERRIAELDPLKEDNDGGIKRILNAAPNAIPSPSMRILWRLMLAGRVKSQSRSFTLYDCLRRLKREGLTPILRMELRKALTPCVRLSEPFHWNQEANESPCLERIRDLAEWEVVLSSDHVHAALRDLGNSAAWRAALADLLQDFTILLRDALDLMKELLIAA